MPEHLAYAAPADSSTADSMWWLAFGDESVHELVRETLNANPSLRAGLARLAASRAEIEQLGASRRPQLSLDGDVTGTERSVRRRGLGRAVSRANEETFNLGLGLRWELDLFGRIAASRDAASRSVQAEAADLAALRLLLVGDLLGAWIDARFARAEKTLIDEQRAAALRQRDLLLNRGRIGRPAVASAGLQESVAEELLADLELVLLREEIARGTLDTLRGVPVGSESTPIEPSLPSELPPVGLLEAGTILRGRPDVAAALARVHAADAEVAAAIADRWPRLGLDLIAAFDAGRLSDLLLEDVVGGALNATVPLVDAGGRRRVVDQRRRLAEAAAEDLTAVVLEAGRELQQAMAEEHRHTLALGRLDLAEQDAASAWQAGRERFVGGNGDPVEAFLALSALQAVKRRQLGERHALCHARIRVAVAAALPSMPQAAAGDA